MFIAIKLKGKFHGAIDFFLLNTGAPNLTFIIDRNLSSIFKILCIFLISIFSIRAKLLIPRSQTRLIKLILFLIFWKRFFIYSDGYGDTYLDFKLKLHLCDGYIGFADFNIDQNLICDVPFCNLIEPWTEYISYDKSAPLLISVKIPALYFNKKEIFCYYDMLINAILTDTNLSLVLTGDYDHLSTIKNNRVKCIKKLQELDAILTISGFCSLPSTLCIGISEKIPSNSIFILKAFNSPVFSTNSAKLKQYHSKICSYLDKKKVYAKTNISYRNILINVLKSIEAI